MREVRQALLRGLLHQWRRLCEQRPGHSSPLQRPWLLRVHGAQHQGARHALVEHAAVAIAVQLLAGLSAAYRLLSAGYMGLEAG